MPPDVTGRSQGQGEDLSSPSAARPDAPCRQPDCPKGSTPLDLVPTSREEAVEEAAGTLEGNRLLCLNSPATQLQRTPGSQESGRTEGGQVSAPDFKRADFNKQREKIGRIPRTEILKGKTFQEVWETEKWEN